MKAAGAAGAVAAVGTTQGAADEGTDEGIVVPQLENAPAELAIGSVIPHRRLGPDVDGGYHTASRWGIHFETDRPSHIEGATIDAQRSGTFTAVLARYDGGSRFEPIAEREIDATGGRQQITLDMYVPEGGEYLLTREGSFPLRRAAWDGWFRETSSPLDVIGGSKPGDYDKPNEYWYYFFNLEVATADLTMSAAQVEGADRKVFDMRTLAENVGLDEGDRCDDLLEDVIGCAETGDKIRFRDGTFRLDDLHVVRKSLVVEGENATLDFGDSGGLHFRGSHYNGASPETTTVPAGSIRKGERSVNTEGTSGFSDGDYVLIETGYTNWSDQHPLRTGSNYKCQVASIEYTSGSWFVLDQATQTYFDMGFDGGKHEIEVHRLEPLENPVFRNLKTVGGEIPLRMECCVNGRFENCEVRNYENYAHRVDYCLGTVYDNPVATNPKGRKSAQGEALQVAHSTDTTINNPRVHKCRRGIDFANGVFEVEINNPYITGVSMHAISTHGGSATAGNIYVDGGVLEADSRDGDSGEYYWGNGISLSRACESAKINGTTIRATRSAISANAHALTATGIVIESVRKSVGSANETLSDDPIAVRFGGGKAYVSGVLNDEHGQFRQISDTRGADSAKIDLV